LYSVFKRIFMTNNVSVHLVFHGAVMLFFGLLLGAPYGSSIKRGAPNHIVNAWRVAHSSLSIGGATVLAIAAVLPFLNAAIILQWLIAIAWIVSSYAFCIALPIAAVTGDRGLASGADGLAKWAYIGNVVGAGFSLLGAAALMFAAGAALFH
jgi:hypothetical protein